MYRSTSGISSAFVGRLRAEHVDTGHRRESIKDHLGEGHPVRPNLILASISYFYLVHAFWLGVGACESWPGTQVSTMNSFDSPAITWFCLLAMLAISTAAIGISLRFVMRWAYYGAVGLSSLVLVTAIGLIILRIVSGGYRVSLVAPLFGIGCHGAVLWLLHTAAVKRGFGLIRWRRMILPGLYGIITFTWLFLAFVQVTVEGRRSIHIVLKPYPTFWSIYGHRIDRLPRDREGVVQASSERKWYRNWDYLRSYQLPLFTGKTI